MKVDILALLASEENCGLLLKEFTRYVADSNVEFVCVAVQAIGRIADAMPHLAPRILGGLMGLVSHRNETVVAASVVVIRQLLQRHPNNEVRSTALAVCVSGCMGDFAFGVSALGLARAAG
jgi:vesicle coat complex subunit